MKILAIRGENLASLAGPFAVELDRSPLSDVGVFAIVGATGAGKSTILDALCLALFGTTPRLDAGSLTRVGGVDDVTARDARSVLRRGTASGRAEVEFRGVEGRRYRARWSVRRARDSRSGLLQPASVSLIDVEANASIGGTSTETRAAIVERLGLGFEQFRRSVLLPQGEFAAFLRGSHDQRSSLLESLTGDAIYTEISKQAFIRKQSAEQEITMRERLLGGIAPLDVAARSALEAELHEAKEAVARSRESARTLDAAIGWHRARTSRIEPLRLAVEQRDGAKSELDSLASLRATLDAIAAVEPVRRAIEAKVEASLSVSRRWEEEAKAQRQVATSAATHLEAKERSDEARRRLEEVRADAQSIAPLIEQAREFDTKIREARDRLEEERARCAVADREVAAARADVADNVARSTLVRATIERFEGELASEAPFAHLREGWSAMRAIVRDYAAVADARAALNVPAVESTASRARAAEVAADAVVAATMASRADRQSAIDCHGVSIEAVSEQRFEARARRAALATFSKSLAAARELTRGIVEARSTEVRARAEAIAATARLIECERQLPASLELLDEASRALRAADAAQDLSNRRLELRAGEPCPLCGAKEHPLASGAPSDAHDDPTYAVIAAWRIEASGRLSERTKTRDALLGAIEVARVEAREARRRADEADARARRAAADEATAKEEARAVGLQLTAPADASDEALAVWVERACIESDDAIVKIDASLVEIKALCAARDVADRDHEAARDVQAVAAAAARVAGKALADALARDADLAADLSAMDARIGPALASIADWRSKLGADRDAFVRDIDRAVARVVAASDSLDRNRTTLAELLSDFVGLTARLEERDAVARGMGVRVVEIERGLASLTAERAQLLGGRPVVDVIEQHRHEVASAEGRLALARDADDVEVRGLASAEMGLQQAQRQVEEARASALRCDEAEAHAIAATGRDRGEIVALLAHDSAWRAAREHEYSAASTRLVQATSIAEERTRSLAEHDALRTTLARASDDQAVLEEALRAVHDDASRAEMTRADREHRLGADDAARDERGSHAEALEQARNDGARWILLGELIGQADGKKFRVFAQQLTFDALLREANVHLRDLSPRYSLMRVPGEELDLQIIDHHMADDIRAVSSLSGGESFLASLALALGLASLGSQRTRVETLFIDEGFGSLDQQTLATVIVALDALQSQGRQIGVISHVEQLSRELGARVIVERRGSERSVVRVERS